MNNETDPFDLVWQLGEESLCEGIAGVWMDYFRRSGALILPDWERDHRSPPDDEKMEAAVQLANRISKWLVFQLTEVPQEQEGEAKENKVVLFPFDAEETLRSIGRHCAKCLVDLSRTKVDTLRRAQRESLRIEEQPFQIELTVEGTVIPKGWFVTQAAMRMRVCFNCDPIFLEYVKIDEA